MIHLLFDFLKAELNQHLEKTETTAGEVGYPKFSTDPPEFKSPGVNLFLVNLEEEPVMRRADRYLQYDESGKTQPAYPPLRLNLYFVLAAKYENYRMAMKQLSSVLEFFQAHPVFTPHSHPGLPGQMDKLVVQLKSLNYSQQNEVWSALKTPALPSVCYKAQLMIIDTKVGRKEVEVSEMSTSLQSS